MDAFVNEKRSYYKQWLFDKPIIVTAKTQDDMKRLQIILRKSIRFFVDRYESYDHLMPLGDKARFIIESFANREYKIGSYRTDFVFDSNNQIQIIEITCRFALNGMFLPHVMNKYANHYRSEQLPQLNVCDRYVQFYEHLFDLIGCDTSQIVVLKGADTRNDSKIYVNRFREVGIQVIEVSYMELDRKIETFDDNCFIISELALDEIEYLAKDTIVKLASYNLINDFRTVFLIHDKRFFALLSDEAFLKEFLSNDEMKFFQRFTIPTYTYCRHHLHHWKSAKLNKDNWIIKHSKLGKSQKIYAGILMTESEWRLVVDNVDDLEDMILQSWIPQNTWSGFIDGNSYEDYVTGTLLYFDDEFYGFGDFRTSSFPVINVVDHRKYASLLSAEVISEESKAEYHVI